MTWQHPHPPVDWLDGPLVWIKGDPVIVREQQRAYYPLPEPFTEPKDVLLYEPLVEALTDKPRERLFAVYTDVLMRCVGIQQLAEGTAVDVHVDIKTLVRGLAWSNASGVILLHNHPSGRAEPSPADEALTKVVAQVCGYCNAVLSDHLVVVDSQDYYSFAYGSAKHQALLTYHP